MHFGLALPSYGKNSSPTAIKELATLVDRVDAYDSVWTTDHVLVPRRYADPYGQVYDAILTLGYVAAFTERVRLGISVLILPQRNPIVVAKQIATLDALSHGRVICGIGIGWLEPEFRNLNADFQRRARFTDEAIHVLRILWTAEAPAFRGRFFRFEDVAFGPRAVQDGGIPIWIGGNTEPAARRAARLGDAWHPVGASPQQIEAGRRIIEQEVHSRNVLITLRGQVDPRAEAPREIVAPTGARREVIGGSPQRVTERLEAYRGAGLEYLVCYFGDIPTPLVRDYATQFARDIIPSFVG